MIFSDFRFGSSRYIVVLSHGEVRASTNSGTAMSYNDSVSRSAPPAPATARARAGGARREPVIRFPPCLDSEDVSDWT